MRSKFHSNPLSENTNPSTTKRGPGRFHEQGYKKTKSRPVGPQLPLLVADKQRTPKRYPTMVISPAAEIAAHNAVVDARNSERRRNKLAA